MNKFKIQLQDAFSFYDDKKTGYITFISLRKILESLKIKLNNEVIEYFIYVMKNFNDDNTSIHDLKYQNLYKILIEENLEENEEDADEESGIEITTEEYVKIIETIMTKFAEYSINRKLKNLDDYFKPYFLKNIAEYKAIELARFVQILNEKFDMHLDHVDIYCLFSRFKHIESSDDNEDEVVDYGKFKSEVKKYLDGSSSSKRNDKVEKEEKNNDFIIAVKNHLSNFKITFENFIFPQIKKMKLSNDNNKNRYLDFKDLQNFLQEKEIFSKHIDSEIKFDNANINKEILFNDNMINIDYLKYIIENLLGGNKKTESKQRYNKDLFYFSEEDYKDDFEMSKRTLKKQNSGDSESFKELQKDLLNDEDFSVNTKLILDDIEDSKKREVDTSKVKDYVNEIFNKVEER